MPAKTITLLNPGDMGSVVGACAHTAGNRVLWVNEGRSAQSHARAQAAGLEAVGSLTDALSESDIVLSVCPPHAAVDTAEAVAATGFSGLYVDGNAISPVTAAKVGAIVRAAGGRFTDGGIIGPPPRKSGSTRLYLSGAHAAQAATVFTGSALETVVMDGPEEAASSIKMCYAAWSKGSTALLADIRALAGALNVEDALLNEWNTSRAGLVDNSEQQIRASAAKAWRWVAEMNEIGDSFASVGLPDGFHRAAAQIYERLAPFKDSQDNELPAILDTINNKTERNNKN